MLTVTATDIYGNLIKMPSPLSLTVNQEKDIPADDLTATFCLIENLSELKEIYLKENNQLVFKGLVDEQQVVSDDNSAYTKIVARSMTALLLDNESKPINYTNPSTSVIFAKHLKPWGFTEYKGEDVTFYGVFNVPKGTTEWQAFYSFCLNAYGKAPRIEADGIANFNGVENQEIIHFSNNDGIGYNFLKENIKRHSLISKVMVKSSEKSGYITEFANPDAINRGVERIRYLDATTSATSINTANKMIENSIEASYEITLVCPSRLLNIIGGKATLDDRSIGYKENLYVSSVCYKLDKSGEYTMIKLKKER